ncbi:MAG: response regulator transcription factor [Parvularcula sp.]|jgi:two-component system cell cycle response regulator CtrA|nr:response regulator transcription factor [Parvularcula sp.]
MDILLIEDDPITVQSLVLSLRQAGMAVTTADCGENGIPLAKAQAFDAILLDLHLPGMSGSEILERMRMESISAPVLILATNEDCESKLTALGTGADDFVTKPFSREELIARIRTIVRRSRGYGHIKITVGEISIDLDTQTAEISGKPFHLTRKEYQLLELLALRKGMTLTKEHLLRHLYAGMDEPASKVIDVFICKLRKKILTATRCGSYIQTIWGHGYVLRDPSTLSDSENSRLGAA